MATQRPGRPQAGARPLSTEIEDASLRTVVVAVAANLLIAVAKGVAAVLTGSAAMAAETTHSLADTCNEVLLYVGLRHGARPADDRHPFGYGQARYFWSLLAAVGIFVIGGLFAIAEGVQTLRYPEPVTDVPIGVAVLLVSAALEGMSWRTARRQLRTEAAARHVDLGEHVATSSDPTAAAVFLEDSAALIGLLLALLLNILTGSAVWDGAASLVIGLLLIVVAFLLIRRNAALLIDEAPPADIGDGLRQAVAEEPWVADVAELTAVYIGPTQLLVLVHVVPVDGTELTAAIRRLRHRLLAVPAIAAIEVTPVDRARTDSRRRTGIEPA